MAAQPSSYSDAGQPNTQKSASAEQPPNYNATASGYQAPYDGPPAGGIPANQQYGPSTAFAPTSAGQPSHASYGAIGVQPSQSAPMIAMMPTVCGQYPMSIACPFCQVQVVTAIKPEPGMLTWLICLVLCVFGCIFGCCLIPFCIDSCQDVLHSCPNCNRLIGRYKRI